MLNRKFNSKIIALVIAAIFGAEAAYAYVPPASYLLSRFQKNRAVVKKFEWLGKIESIRTGTIFYELLQADLTTNRIRLFYGSQPSPLAVFASKGIRSTAKVSELGRAWMGAQFSAPGSLMSTLDRIQNRSGWRLVVEGDQKSKSYELWIEKDRFIFAGLNVGETALEVVQPSPIDVAVHFPRKLLVKQSSEEMFRYELVQFKVDNFTEMDSVTGMLPDPAAVEEWISLVR